MIIIILKKVKIILMEYGIANGGTITIKANRGSYQGKDEALNAYFVSYNGQGGDTPGGGETTGEIGRAHVWTPVTVTDRVCRLLL